MIKFILLTAFLVTNTDIDKDNYCHSPEKNATMARLLKEYPNDENVLKMFALRLGFCAMIDFDAISLDRAIDLFEREREKVIEEIRSQENTTQHHDL